MHACVVVAHPIHSQIKRNEIRIHRTVPLIYEITPFSLPLLCFCVLEVSLLSRALIRWLTASGWLTANQSDRLSPTAILHAAIDGSFIQIVTKEHNHAKNLFSLPNLVLQILPHLAANFHEHVFHIQSIVYL